MEHSCLEKQHGTYAVTTYLIVVEAASQKYDTQGNKLAREILFLPTTHFPSLAAMAASEIPFAIRTAQLYYLTGQLTPAEVDRLVQQLLVDPIVQQVNIHPNPVKPAILQQHKPGQAPSSNTVDVFFHPGVTHSFAESVMNLASLLDIRALEQVQTGRRYILDGCLSETDVRAIIAALLYNPVIQRYTLHQPGQDGFQTTNLEQPQAERLQEHLEDRNVANRFHFLDMTDDELVELSKAGMLALDLNEMRAIQAYYREQQREPTDVELETLAQTWSEHCSHKTFKATIAYREVDSTGTTLEEETINGLLKQYIMRATERINPSWLVSAFSDNAGIIRFTESHDIALKVETHNHPSAIEPFGGANTGVGGVIRDILGVSAKPIANTDVLCFGPQDLNPDTLPEGVLHPRRIQSGVVAGVQDYGNKIGIPTVNGAILYDEGYTANPLVFCGCVGIAPKGKHRKTPQVSDRVVVLGGRTGRDGLRGATFYSMTMDAQTGEVSGASVQIGDPITEKGLIDVIVRARDLRLYNDITDCGAGGLSSAVGEMASSIGCDVELTHVRLKYPGLAPWEIWPSEAQERIVLAVAPENVSP